jgi:predicted nucleic acid-binding protein
VLDTGPLGLLAHSWAMPQVRECNRWLRAHASGGTRVVIPEIADYEVRRELLRVGGARKLLRLESLSTIAGVEYDPITTQAMRLAAELWAQSRRAGQPTADPKELDADVILAAQARLVGGSADVVVATTNVGHIGRFIPAAAWREIVPPAATDGS